MNAFLSFVLLLPPFHSSICIYFSVFYTLFFFPLFFSVVIIICANINIFHIECYLCACVFALSFHSVQYAYRDYVLTSVECVYARCKHCRSNRPGVYQMQVLRCLLLQCNECQCDPMKCMIFNTTDWMRTTHKVCNVEVCCIFSAQFLFALIFSKNVNLQLRRINGLNLICFKFKAPFY